MKSSTAKLRQPAMTRGFALTRVQAEKISAVEGRTLTLRMKRIVDLPASGEERRSLVKVQVRKK